MGRERWRARARIVAALVVPLLVLLGRPAAAQIGSERFAAVALDASNGAVLFATNADQPRYPASLTKLMTLYMLFEALRDRRVFLDEPVPVSPYAASVQPSKLGLVPGMQITVEEALLGLVTKSANDAATAIGELLAGDEERFAQMMTLRARALGMAHTTFRNASGLPDPDQVTTAQDMAILARHLIQDFPREYGYFSVPGFVFRGRMVPNHDRMLETFPGADGLKTGYTLAAGHNLVTSALRGGVRLIGVVLGAGSTFERDQDMTAMLTAGFDRMGVPPGAYAPPPAMVASLPATIPAPPSPRFSLVGIARAEPLLAEPPMPPRLFARHRGDWDDGPTYVRPPRGARRSERFAFAAAAYKASARHPGARNLMVPAMAATRSARAIGGAHPARRRVRW